MEDDSESALVVQLRHENERLRDELAEAKRRRRLPGLRFFGLLAQRSASLVPAPLRNVIGRVPSALIAAFAGRRETAAPRNLGAGEPTAPPGAPGAAGIAARAATPAATEVKTEGERGRVRRRW